MNKKHILILGGMGPQASVYAHSLLLKVVAQQNINPSNEEYPRITHLSLNVKDFITDPERKDEALEYINQSLSEVNTSTVTDAFIACNTAHLLLTEIEQSSGLKFTSLIDVAEKFVSNNDEINVVGLLATPSTLKSGLYSDRLKNMVQLVEPDAESSATIDHIIRDVISGEDNLVAANELKKEIFKLIARGSQRIILGCTELSLLGSYLDEDMIIDPLSLTVKELLR